jgi:hypothetical protein
VIPKKKKKVKKHKEQLSLYEEYENEYEKLDMNCP